MMQKRISNGAHNASDFRAIGDHRCIRVAIKMISQPVG
jgi:hypothetical protein